MLVLADHTANTSAIAIAKKPGRPHLTRWYTHVETLPVPKGALDSYNKARVDHDKGKKLKRTETVEVVLPNAVKGKVVVRFGKSVAFQEFEGFLVRAKADRSSA